MDTPPAPAAARRERGPSTFLVVIAFITIFWVGVNVRASSRLPERVRPVGGQLTVWPPIDRYEEPVGKPRLHSATGLHASLRAHQKAVTAGKPATPTPDDSDESSADARSGDEQAATVKPQENKRKTAAERLLLADPLDWSDTSLLDKCPHTFVEADLNMKYVQKFQKIFTQMKAHWWLDEGGLIGAARAGGMTNADDDFDFFALLPNQLHPCSPDKHGCNKDEEFKKMIHAFLMEFWNEGMCINNFDPDYSKFDNKNKLMYSLMLDRNRVYQPNAKSPGARCFEHGKTPRFAHMHMALLTEDGKHLETNIWAKGHKHDKIPLDLVLPVRKCRTGALEAPCPNNIGGFLKMRNEGEYNRASSQGNCLLVRKKWSQKKKDDVIQLTNNLHDCGYNSMHDLIEPARASKYMEC